MANVDDLTKLRIDPQLKRAPKGRGLVKLFLWAVVILAIGGGLWAYPYLVPEKVDVAPVRLIDPEVETSAVVLSVTGYVVPHRRIEIAPKIMGRIEQLYVDKGDHVVQYQEVAHLDASEYKANVERARALLARSEAVLAELRAGSRPQEIEQLRAELSLAEAQQRDARQNLDRVRPLVQQKVEGQNVLDKAVNDYDIAVARANSVRKKLELAVIGPRAEVIKAAEAGVAEARANISLAEVQLNDCIIRSPTTGTILERLVEVGEMVTNTNFGGTRGARSALISVANLSDMQVEIDLNQSDLSRVRLDQQCLISLEAYPDREYRGRVERIAPEANRQKATVQVEVEFLDPDERVKPELNARVSFLDQIERKQGVKLSPRIFVPSGAVIERDASPSVIIAAKNRARVIKVRRGMETPNGVEILEGLKGNERVLVKPPDGIKEGAAIRINTLTAK
ncbi:MAG: efflux RND transporter periplasmic adaptor subunit [bacterium]|nr:efflux RND transporter periplasmic adaptor subunit [Candidatus Sumerlaeota bacterium]